MPLRLKDKLEEIGFGDRIEVIDNDLRKSAVGYMEREGFKSIITNSCHERAGAMAAWEASDLACSHFEWQNLSRFCKVSWTLVIDESGIYDPTNLDDMAMFGIKAALSDYELNMLVKRAQAGILQKARVMVAVRIGASPYEVDRRERQFNVVEPEHRLVIRELLAL